MALMMCLPAALQAADLSAVRQNVVGYYTGAGADRTLPRVADSLAAIEANARAVTDPLILRADGSWSDIDYTEVPSGVWSPWDHFRRIMIMARAFATDGQDRKSVV